MSGQPYADADTEAALAVIRAEESGPRANTGPVVDHAPGLVRVLERMVEETRGGAA